MRRLLSFWLLLATAAWASAASQEGTPIWLPASQGAAYSDLAANAGQNLWTLVGQLGAKRVLPDLKGHYVYYRHEDLSVWIGPYDDLNGAATDLSRLHRLTAELREKNPQRYGNARAVRIFAPEDDTIKKLARDDPKALELGWVLETYGQLESIELADKELKERAQKLGQAASPEDIKAIEATVSATERRVQELELFSAGMDEGFVAASVFGNEKVLPAAKAGELKEALAAQLAKLVDPTLDTASLMAKLSKPGAVQQMRSALTEGLQRQGLSSDQIKDALAELTELADSQALASPTSVRAGLRRASDAYLAHVAGKAGVPESALATRSLEAQALVRIADAAEFGRDGVALARVIRQYLSHHALDAAASDESLRATTPSPAMLARSLVEAPEAGPPIDVQPAVEAFRNAVPTTAVDLESAAHTGLNNAAANTLIRSIEAASTSQTWKMLEQFSRASREEIAAKGISGTTSAHVMKWAQAQGVTASDLGLSESEAKDIQTKGLSGQQTRKLAEQVAARHVKSTLTSGFEQALHSEANITETSSGAEAAGRLSAALQGRGMPASQASQKGGESSSATALNKAVTSAAASLAERVQRESGSARGSGSSSASGTSGSGLAGGPARGSPPSGKSGASSQTGGADGQSGRSQGAGQTGSQSGSQRTGDGRGGASGGTSAAGGSAGTSGAGTAGSAGGSGGGLNGRDVGGILASVVSRMSGGGSEKGGKGGDHYQVKGSPRASSREVSRGGRSEASPSPPSRTRSDTGASPSLTSAFRNFASASGIGFASEALLRAAKAEHRASFDQMAELAGQSQAVFKQALASRTEAQMANSVRPLAANLAKLERASTDVFDRRLPKLAKTAHAQKTDAYSAPAIRDLARKQGVSEAAVRRLQDLPDGFDAAQAAKAMVASTRFLAAVAFSKAGSSDSLASAVIKGDREGMRREASGYFLNRVRVYLSSLGASTNLMPLLQRAQWKEAASVLAGTPRPGLNQLAAAGVITPKVKESLERGQNAAAARHLATQGADSISLGILKASGIQLERGRSASWYFDAAWAVEGYLHVFHEVLGTTLSETSAMESGNLDQLSRARFHEILFNWGRSMGWEQAAKALRVDEGQLKAFAQAKPWDAQGPDVPPTATPGVPRLDEQTRLASLQLRLMLLQTSLENALRDYESALKP